MPPKYTFVSLQYNGDLTKMLNKYVSFILPIKKYKGNILQNYSSKSPARIWFKKHILVIKTIKGDKDVNCQLLVAKTILRTTLKKCLYSYKRRFLKLQN